MAIVMLVIAVAVLAFVILGELRAPKQTTRETNNHQSYIGHAQRLRDMLESPAERLERATYAVESEQPEIPIGSTEISESLGLPGVGGTLLIWYIVPNDVGVISDSISDGDSQIRWTVTWGLRLSARQMAPVNRANIDRRYLPAQALLSSRNVMALASTLRDAVSMAQLLESASSDGTAESTVLRENPPRVEVRKSSSGKVTIDVGLLSPTFHFIETRLSPDVAESLGQCLETLQERALAVARRHASDSCAELRSSLDAALVREL